MTLKLHRHCGVACLSFRASSVAAFSSTTTTTTTASSRPPCKLWYNDVYEVPLPPTHRFPMEKYSHVRRRLQQILTPAQLATFHVSPLASEADLTTTHTADYVARFLSNEFTARENRVVGFPWSPESVDRALSSVGGTVAATHAVCRGETPVAGHIAGGTHHAFADRGEGFCVFSDIAVAANVALRDYPQLVQKVLIVDLDVHQGNGNAVLFEDDPRVFTFSVHCTQNFFSKERVSDLDVELPKGSGDDDYVALLRKHLKPLLEHTQPDLVYYQSGVDVSRDDRLGHLELTADGVRRRNELVYDAVLNLNADGSSTSKKPPLLVVCMGGGYPKDLNPESSSFKAVVEHHAQVYVGAAQACARL